MVYGGIDGQRAVERHGFTHEQGAEDPVNGSTAWPVGSVFISVVTTNPSTLLGFGTWTQIAAGRMLIGVDTGTAAYDTPEETGGSATQADHTGHGAHGDHANLTHTNNHSVTQPAAHADHGTNLQTDIVKGTPGAGQSNLNITEFNGSGQAAHNNNHNSTAVAAHGDHDIAVHANDAAISSHGTNLPPYFAVYIWKRAA